MEEKINYCMLDACFLCILGKNRIVRMLRVRLMFQVHDHHELTIEGCTGNHFKSNFALFSTSVW